MKFKLIRKITIVCFIFLLIAVLITPLKKKIISLRNSTSNKAVIDNSSSHRDYRKEISEDKFNISGKNTNIIKKNDNNIEKKNYNSNIIISTASPEEISANKELPNAKISIHSNNYTSRIALESEKRIENSNARENTYHSLNKNNNSNQQVFMTYRIDEKHPFSYYQHYFVKNRLIVFPETEGEYPYTLGKCTDANCYNCDPLSPDICKKCGTGFYLYNASCEMICPEGFIANTLTQSCHPTKLNENSFLMAYSIGSCVNKCGSKSSDCSCSAECKKTGDCCSDYNLHDCDKILDGAKIVQEQCQKSCMLCNYKLENLETNKPICVQCPPGKLFYKGKCYSQCPEDTFQSDINDTCHEIKSNIIFFKFFNYENRLHYKEL